MWIIKNEEIWQSIVNQNWQMEFDWLGIDAYGHLAIFSNFNSGFTPDCVTSSMALYNELVDFIARLEKTSAAIKVIETAGKYDDWQESAQKGLWAYDNENIHSTDNPNRYHLLCKPTRPINSKTYDDLRRFESIIPVFNIEFKYFLTFEELKRAIS